FARCYWRNHSCFLFLWVLRWFTSPRCLPTAYGFSGGSFGMSQRGFPHSEIPGSKLVCSSPGLIAAYHVLRRLLAPRHSPYALSSLTIRNSELTLAGFRLTAPGFRAHRRSPSPNFEPNRRSTGEVSTTVERSGRSGGLRGPRGGQRASIARLRQSGEYRARTGDLLVANQALSQLS